MNVEFVDLLRTLHRISTRLLSYGDIIHTTRNSISFTSHILLFGSLIDVWLTDNDHGVGRFVVGVRRTAKWPDLSTTG